MDDWALFKVTIDGIAHYVDNEYPIRLDMYKTMCGETIQPFTYRDWQKKAQKCPKCMTIKEEREKK